jgi:3-deoxy-7-phosphoheptulonate synthase
VQARTLAVLVQGLGERALEILARVREEFDLPIVTEAVDHESLQLVEQYGDCIQIGARNMQNFSLLKSAGRSRKPILLKRGMAATLEELLLSAEYIMSEGNYNVILCERGVRTSPIINAQHPRPLRRPGRETHQPPPHPRRPQPRHRQTQQKSCPCRAPPAAGPTAC